jgi:uncharacterized protein YjlB
VAKYSVVSEKKFASISSVTDKSGRFCEREKGWCLVIPDGLTKNCVLSSGRFGVVGAKTGKEGWVRGQGVPSQRKIILPRTVPFSPG